jgi:hypothetical protein
MGTDFRCILIVIKSLWVVDHACPNRQSAGDREDRAA